ncbi:caspase-8-like [Alosa sapidissima]|uniref:caspase-8-like n=1 Tax=Alosa sapidissima TaxID=34773 RepID=UPI001C0952F9|nr:caspase-8-like [Alosa sapidissima]
MEENNLQLLYDIDDRLDSEEVASLKFLCSDVLGRKPLQKVNDGRDLFMRLNEKGHMEDDMMFLKELLYTIRRYDLLKMMKTTEQEVCSSLQMHSDSYGGLSTYRKMLFDIADNMTSEKLNSFKFLVNLPRGKLEASATIFDVLTEMEKQQQLTEDNVEHLERILNQCDKDLARKVEKYRLNKTGDGRWPEYGNSLHSESMSIAEMHRGEDYEDRFRNRGLSVVSDAGPVTNEITKEEDVESYTMNSRPRGYCLIINNYRFSHPEYRHRDGTVKDAEDLRRVFERLQFMVEDQTDLSGHDMRMVLEKYATLDHSAYNALVVCVLSHGLEGKVLGVDGEEVSIKQLYRPFAHCPTLVGKPKLFFIQACQGAALQTGHLLEDGPNQQLDELLEEDALNPLVNKPSVAVEADVLIGMSTVEEFKSFRHTMTGSIYIQALCKALETGCQRKEDLHTILTRVNNDVSKGVFNNWKQMPQQKSTLRKKLVLTMD